MTDVENPDELLDYDDEVNDTAQDEPMDSTEKKNVTGAYVSVHSSGFRDFLLRPELLKAIIDCGFEHPSEGNLIQDSETFISAINN